MVYSREKCVQNSLSSQQWMISRKLLCDRPDLSHWPHLQRGELLLHAFKFELQNHILSATRAENQFDVENSDPTEKGFCTWTDTHSDVVVSRRGEVGDGASVARWKHQLVPY